jgi:hypothetical protein
MSTDSQTAKDRFLFLFNDILVITKPLITYGNHATLDMQYCVKYIIPLDQLHVTGFEDAPEQPERSSILDDFIGDFAVDATEAFRYFPERFGVNIDEATMAALVFKTPGFDKAQIGKLLCDNDKLKTAFLERFNFASVPIDEALRIFLLSLRLPPDANASQDLLHAFSQHWHKSNRNSLAYDSGKASDLVASMIQLNDALYGSFGRTSVNKAITLDVFTKSFDLKDPESQVPKNLLAEIYASIRKNALVHALSPREQGQALKVKVSPASLSRKLTYGVWSDRICISIPEPDTAFQINLHGHGLDFDPPALDFSSSADQSFRVKGTSLGSKSMLFARLGANA